MTTTEIITACVGFLLCAFIFALICILILGVIWWMFKNDMDFDDIANMEDPEEL